MSLKGKSLAAAAALTLAGTACAFGAVTTTAANAATSPCGRGCIDIFSRLFGTHSGPSFVLAVSGPGAATGTPIILSPASNADPNEDFTVSFEGTVNEFYQANLVTSALDLHYHNLYAYEIQYSPDGVETGQCMGVGSTAADGTRVTLEPCGASSKTVWIVDAFSSIRGHYAPLINGSDVNFSQPYVLNYPSSGYPTDQPRPELQTWTLQKFSNHSTASNELFSADFGVLP
jgi:hypothetical protein